MTITRQILGRLHTVTLDPKGTPTFTLVTYAGTSDETRIDIRGTRALAEEVFGRYEYADRDWCWSVNGRGTLASVAYDS